MRRFVEPANREREEQENYQQVIIGPVIGKHPSCEPCNRELIERAESASQEDQPTRCCHEEQQD